MSRSALTPFILIFEKMGSIIQRVSLEAYRQYAYHGFYPLEQKIGSEFIVDIHTETEVYGDGEDQLQNTVNYERLFQIAKAEMDTPRKLIETVAHRILDQIRHEFLATKSIQVRIRKINPPLGAEIANSAVELFFKR